MSFESNQKTLDRFSYMRQQFDQGIIFTNCTKQNLSIHKNQMLTNRYSQDLKKLINGELPVNTTYGGKFGACHRREVRIGDLLDNIYVLDPLPVTDFRVSLHYLYCPLLTRRLNYR